MASRRDRMRSTHPGTYHGNAWPRSRRCTLARFSIFDGSSLRSCLATLIPWSKRRYRKASINSCACIRGRTHLGTSLGIMLLCSSRFCFNASTVDDYSVKDLHQRSRDEIITKKATFSLNILQRIIRIPNCELVTFRWKITNYGAFWEKGHNIKRWIGEIASKALVSVF